MTSVRMTVLAASMAIAAAGPALLLAAKRPVDIPVRSIFADADLAGMPYTIQSDGLGSYVNGTDRVVSVLMANVYNNLYNGDWEMDASGSTMRKVYVTLAPSNAIPFGSTGYTVAPKPPFWGTAPVAARLIDKCTAYGKSVLTLSAGASITCPVLVRWGAYRLDMGTPIEAPESTAARITCNSVDAAGCTDWSIDPMPRVSSDGTTSDTAIARLVSVANNGTATNLGDFYVTFHFHVARP